MEEELEVNIVLPVSDEKLQELKDAMQKDEVLKKLRNYVEFGWPDHLKGVDQSVASYWDFKEYITVRDDLLFKGDRLIDHSGVFGGTQRRCIKIPRSIVDKDLLDLIDKGIKIEKVHEKFPGNLHGTFNFIIIYLVLLE